MIRRLVSSLRRPKRPHLTPEQVADLEREVGLYQGDGYVIGDCPECGNDVVISAPPDAVATYLCASCSLSVLASGAGPLAGKSDEDRRQWSAFLHECCCWAGLQSESCRMSGCCHDHWRREAGRLWRVKRRRRAEQLASDDDFAVVTSGSGRSYRLLSTPVDVVLARTERREET